MLIAQRKSVPIYLIAPLAGLHRHPFTSLQSSSTLARLCGTWDSLSWSRIPPHGMLLKLRDARTFFSARTTHVSQIPSTLPTYYTTTSHSKCVSEPTVIYRGIGTQVYMDDETLLKCCYELMLDYVRIYRLNTRTEDGREQLNNALGELEPTLIELLIEADERGYNLPDYQACRYKIEQTEEYDEFLHYFKEHLDGEYAPEDAPLVDTDTEWLE